MTKPRTDREVVATLRVLTVPASPDWESTVPCLNCQIALDIHQPDAGLPERMLATCPGCRSWHLIDCGTGPGPGETLIVLLPDPAPFRGAPGPVPPAAKPGPPRGPARP